MFSQILPTTTKKYIEDSKENMHVDNRIYGRWLLIEMYFCKGYDYGKKVALSKGNWNPKRKMWVTTHFSEIVNQP